MAAQESSNKTFRFKFSEQFQCILEEFAKLHRYDNRHIFKEAWEKWIELHDSEITQETTRLKTNGYEGAPLDKMYKSARYYFKNKSTAKKEPKKRRKYVTIDKTFLGQMDKHINEVAFAQDLKPAHAYNNFISDDKYSIKMDEIIQDLMDENDLEEVAVEKKICKTYKNRYFIQQKSKGKKDN